MIATPATNDADFFARLRVQSAAFRTGLPELLGQLAALHDPATPTPAPACSAELQHRLHTLAGCAATLGYRRLGVEARALEQRLRVLQAFDAVPAVDWMEWFSQLAAMTGWASVDPHAGHAAATTPQLF